MRDSIMLEVGTEYSISTYTTEPSTPLSGIQFASFDVETTGLSPVGARLVELSGVRFDLSGQTISTFSSLINPETDIPPEVTNIHGITNSMVADQPTADEVVPAFMEWIGGADVVMVAHNAPFDMEFLSVALAKLGKPAPQNLVIDTLQLSRFLIDDCPNHQLKTLVEHLGLEAGDYHRALADSVHVKDLLIKVLQQNSAIATWEDLAGYNCVLDYKRFFATTDDAHLPANQVAFLEVIRKAMETQDQLRMIYNGARSFVRTVKPIALIQSRGNYYMSAYCNKVDAERTFRIDKITSIKAAPGR